MVERGEPPQFGDKPPTRSRRIQAVPRFPAGDDTPIFSGTPQPAIERPYVPEDHRYRQALLPEMPDIDYDAVLARDKVLRHGHTPPRLPTTTPVLFPDE